MTVRRVAIIYFGADRYVLAHFAPVVDLDVAGIIEATVHSYTPPRAVRAEVILRGGCPPLVYDELQPRALQ